MKLASEQTVQQNSGVDIGEIACLIKIKLNYVT
jgi:hypothetical protein